VYISIRGPKSTAQIKHCMAELRAVVKKCRGTMTQENVRNPIRRTKKSRRRKR
jgi:hypothetical protein